MQKINYSVLTQAEYSEFQFLVLGIVEKHDPAVVGVKPFFDELKASESHLSLLTEPRVKHPLTSSIQQDDKRVRELCLVVLNQLQNTKKSNLSVFEPALFVLEPLAKQYLANNSHSNREKLNDRLRNFLERVKADAAMNGFVKLLGVDMYIAELAVVKSRMDENSATRTEAFVRKRTVREMQIRKSIDQKLLNLLKAIDLAKVTNKTYDFSGLDTELGLLFDTYRSKIRSRTTRNLNKAIKKESAASTTKSVATETLEDGLV